MTDDRSMMGRILIVLDCCLRSPGPVPLRTLSAETGLPKSTAWRIAERLVAQGLLTRGPAGYHGGGSGLAARAARAARQRELRAFVTPELVDLHRSTGAPVWAVDVHDDDAWSVVGSIYDQAAVQMRYSDAWVHDPHDPAILATALGHVALADRPELAEGLIRQGIPRLTGTTVADPHRLLGMLRRAGEDGELIEHGNFGLGWSCAAFAIRSGGEGRVVGVLGIVTRTPRFMDARFTSAGRASAARLGRLWPST